MRSIIFAATIISLFLIQGIAIGQTSPTATPASTTGKSAQEYFLKAHEAFGQNDLDKAILNCRLAISINPDFVDAHYMLGKAYLFNAAKANRLSIRNWGVGSPETRYLRQYVNGRSDLRKAIKHFKIAIKLNPDDNDAYLNLAIAQDNYGQEDEAIKNYNTAITLDPISTQARDAWNNLGLLYVSTNKHKLAIKAYKSALKIDPNFIPAKLNLQRLMDSKGK